MHSQRGRSRWTEKRRRAGEPAQGVRHVQQGGCGRPEPIVLRKPDHRIFGPQRCRQDHNNVRLVNGNVCTNDHRKLQRGLDLNCYVLSNFTSSFQ